jgi:hypothetical protein
MTRGVAESGDGGSVPEIGVVSGVDTLTGYPGCLVAWLLILERFGEEGDEVW